MTVILTRVPARLLAVAGLVALVLLGAAGQGWAHPFGPPPVAKVTADGAVVEVRWSAAADDLVVLGRAAGELGAAEPGEAGTPALAERLGASTAVRDYLRRHVGVAQDGRDCPVESVRTENLAADGAVLRFRCPSPVSGVRLTITTLTDADRAYRTVSTTPEGSSGLHTADAPAQRLRLGSGAGAGSDPATAPSPSIPGLSGTVLWAADLSSLMDHDAVLPLALLVALAAGAVHACAPGHGKTLTAGYLVGGNGQAWDAVRLGVIVAVMHTVSVAVLAIGWWLTVANAPDLEAITRWLQLAASLIVLAVGVGLLRRHLRDRGREHSHGHGHGHGHGRGYGYDHGHGQVVPLLTRRGILMIGVSGGLLPSPSAFLLLLTGLLSGRAAFALALVAAFGIGMALTLAGIGLAVLRGRDVLAGVTRSPRLRAWSRRLPLVAAALVVAGGCVASGLAAARLIEW
ncbi:hypothetical protein [Streptosporangium roseum]|uniref:hypothetical protein n=1 Tax=Streptosporangium roseum TaxID=2001 RepID=UPI00332D3CA9